MAAENSTIPDLTGIIQNSITGTEELPLSQGTADLKIRINQIPHDLIYQAAGSNNQHLTLAEKTSVLAAKPTTVGTGGEYATVGAAITAGAKRMFLLSNTTETGDISVSNVYIDLNNFVLNMQSYNISGAINIENGTINFAYSIEKILLTSGANTIVSNVTFNNTSTINSARIADGGFFQNVTANLPNYTYNGFGKSGGEFNGKLSYVKLNGGGANCQFVIYISSTSQLVDNIEFVGTYGATCAYIGKAASNIIYSSASSSKLIVAYAIGVYDANASVNKLTIECRGALSNFLAASVTAFSNGVVISNGFIFTTSTITIGRFDNITFTENVTITGNNVSLVNCLAGSTTAGAKTITVNNTANRTILVGNRTEAAIVDNGISTEKTANSIF